MDVDPLLPIEFGQVEVQRSLSLPLEFCAGEFTAPDALPEYGGYSDFSLVSANIDRLAVLRNFHLDGSPESESYYMVAPKLEFLGLVGRSPGDVYHQLPLIKDGPRLKKLELVDCRLSWQPSLYRDLTSLKIAIARLEQYKRS